MGKTLLSNNFVGKKVPQFLGACAACMGAFTLGTAVAWTSPVLPDLDRSGDYGVLTLNEKTWIAALLTLGGLFSGPFAGWALNQWGRRGSLIYLSIPCLLAWPMIASGSILYILYIGRFLLGFSIGSYAIIVNVYIAEISENDIRGRLGLLYPIFLSSGILYTYIFGAFVSWKILTFVNIAFPLQMLIGIFLVPESPIYLLSKGKKKAAGKALQWFRGSHSFHHIEEELEHMQYFVEDNAKKSTPLNEYLKPFVIKPTLISIGLFFFHQFSGVNVVLFYTVEIFQSTGSNIEPSLATIIVGLVFLLSTCTSAVVIDKVGRRILLIISALGMSISLASLGLFFYWKENNDGETPENLGYLPLISLMVYILSLNGGFGPIPWIMLGELIPSNVKGGASALVVSMFWLTGFLMIKTFGDLLTLFGTYGLYWFFSFFCFLAILFSYFIVPETRGKNFEELENLFK